MTSTRPPEPEPRAGARLAGLGTYRPRRVVGNDEVCARLDVEPDWVAARSGIRTRRFAADDETVVAMGTAAARAALRAADVPADRVDATLVATMSQGTSCPQVSTRIAAALGAPGPAIDIGAACAGFCYAIELASSMIRAGTCAHVLVVGVERMSDLLDPTDRSTAFLFGDGAGAVVVGPAGDPEHFPRRSARPEHSPRRSARPEHSPRRPGIGPVVWGADGEQAGLIVQEPTWLEAARATHGASAGLRMEGPAVFRWATTHMAPVVRDALEVAGVEAESLGAFVPHQANNRITDALVRALDLPEHVAVARDVVDAGNTSAASVPLAMGALLDGDGARPGDLALLVGFGAGLTYAAQVVELPPLVPAEAATAP